MAVRVGVDTGGTFTDLVVLGGPEVIVVKLPTTRPDPSPGVLAALEQALETLSGPFELTHGTTVGTNALLERKGARTALVTTAGFRDLLVLARGQRPRLYALEPRREAPLVDAADTFAVEQRTAPDGSDLIPLSEAAIDEVVQAVVASGAESVAVCLLFAYANPQAETRLGAALEAAGLAVSLSSHVSPEFREYERASTTVVNAYLQPVLRHYLSRLERESAQLGATRFWVVHSAGAVMSAAQAGERAVGAVLSGPAAGVQGAFAVAGAAGHRQLMTLDMGGTSTDVALCPGALPYVSQGQVGSVAVRQLMLDLHTVGAGGGSIAFLDAGGALRVGPESAGSDPGPAAYGKGTSPTVTDAHLVLGRLPTRLAGGRVELNRDRARQALARLGAAMDMSAERAAAAVLEVAATHMERALRVISVERGYDPRRFTLVPFGGAGPLQAAELAERLKLTEVLVPPNPGLLCALGAAVSPWLREFSRTHPALPCDPLEPYFLELEAEARAEMGRRCRLERWVDLRYRGQGTELCLRYRPEGLEAAFHRAHRRRYGYARPEFTVQVVTLRVRAQERRAPYRPLPWPRTEAGRFSPTTIWLGSDPKPVEAQQIDRSQLARGQEWSGPCLVHQYDSTTLVPAHWQARVDDWGNLLLQRESLS